MTLKEALVWGAQKLNNTKINNPSLDAVVLLSLSTKKTKEFIYTYPEKQLTGIQEKKYKYYIKRRAKHEPVAYITGHKEFYNFDFFVCPEVLIPRPETELLIEQIKNPKNIIDVGIGSGAIAITLKKIFPKAHVYGTEISSRAIMIAKKNAKKMHAKITIKKGNLLSPFEKLPEKTIITANLPYLSKKEWEQTIPDVKKYEPRSALVGGTNGWELYEELFKQIQSLFPKNITLVLEIGWKQKTIITKLLKKYLQPKKIKAMRDLNKKWRIIVCEL